MKKLFAICLLFLIFACSKEKKQGNMIVQGQIKGLKKGTLYLQKLKDTLVVSVDSISLLGKDEFLLSDNVDSPEMYYLTFDGNTSEKRIIFFGEQGTITINDDVKRFGLNTKIEGSKNQKVYEDYQKMTSKFQGKQLDLFEANFLAQKEKDVKKSDSLRKLSEDYLKRRYLYSINFALNHPDDEASAYIALTDLADANVKYLDTINKSLSERVKASLYGKKLAKFIDKIKNQEDQP
ncbi:DUF4369 domain-containing protein [Pseudotenacibaculum sp. MALMAid0570]|uniref:DUF4369 domain-containing protein n=1 Tax=Pseudotenacibaculum sp. MALMAid0570 TaxID=3143938 RepID=UPI0032E00A2B